MTLARAHRSPRRRRRRQPAGGAALDQVAIATAGAIARHRRACSGSASATASGRVAPRSRRLAAFSERVSGLPGWAALPLGIAGGSLLVALLGMYWDISLHIDQGRDPGPLANPAHYFILVGLFGIFAAGCLAIALPEESARAAPRCGSRATGTRRSAAC